MRTTGATGLALGLILGAAMPADAGERLTYEAVHGESGPERAGAFVATTTLEWQALWDTVQQAPPRALKEGEETGIGVFMGTRPSGGYGYKIRHVERDDGNIEIKTIAYAPEGAAPQGESAPYVILLVRGTGERTLLHVRSELDAPNAPKLK